MALIWECSFFLEEEKGDLGEQYHGMGIGMMERVFLSKPAAFFCYVFTDCFCFDWQF